MRIGLLLLLVAGGSVVLAAATDRLPTLAGLERHHRGVFGGLFVAVMVFLYGDPPRARFPQHDWLDGDLVVRALRAGSGGLFDLDAQLGSVLGGIPLSALSISDLNPFENLYLILSPFVAMIAGEVLLRTLALIGAYLLFRRILGSAQQAGTSAASAALLFALLPYWTSFTATIALQPLFIVGLLGARDDPRRLAPWLGVVLLPLSSNLVQGGFAATAVLPVAVGVEWWRGQRTEAKRLALATGVVALAWVPWLVRPVHLLLATDFVSFRTDWPRPERLLLNPGSLGAFVTELPRMLLKGEYHMASGLRGAPLVAVAMVAVALWAIRSDRDRLEATAVERRALSLLAGALLVITVFAAAEVAGVTGLGRSLPVPIGLERIVSLSPLLMVMIVAVSATLLFRIDRRWARNAAVVLVAFATFQAVTDSHGFRSRIDDLSDLPVSGPSGGARIEFGLEDYYDTETYVRLANQAGADPEELTVVSLGLEPMKAAFNGFRTLDGYWNNYPLGHKRAFRPIIAGELERSEGMRRYYDEWGGRVYLWHESRPDGRLYLDFCAAHALGADHVIAAGRVRDPSHPLVLVSEVEDLTLYRIDSDACRAD